MEHSPDYTSASEGRALDPFQEQQRWPETGGAKTFTNLVKLYLELSPFNDNDEVL